MCAPSASLVSSMHLYTRYAQLTAACVRVLVVHQLYSCIVYIHVCICFSGTGVCTCVVSRS